MKTRFFRVPGWVIILVFEDFLNSNWFSLNDHFTECSACSVFEIYIHKTVVCAFLSVRTLSAARVSRRRTPRSTVMRPPCDWRLIQTKKPCAKCVTSRGFSPLLCVGFPTCRQRTLMNPHTLSPFFFIGFPTSANKRASCIQSYDRLQPTRVRCEELFAAEAWPARNRRCAQTDHKPGVHG